MTDLVQLIRLEETDLPEFKKEMQKAFQYGYETEFGPCEDAVLPEEDIERSLKGAGAIAYGAWKDGIMTGGAVVKIDRETRHNHLDLLFVRVGTQSEGVGQAIWNGIESLHPETEMPTVEIDGVDYIGTLTIPVLELELPIVSRWSDTLLELAPCRYTGSAYLDNLIIAGHNYRGHFGSLDQLTLGDMIQFTDAAGNVFSYTVSEIEELPGSALEEMEAGEWDLTLFTCTMSRINRITIRCDRIEDAVSSDAARPTWSSSTT